MDGRRAVRLKQDIFISNAGSAARELAGSGGVRHSAVNPSRLTSCEPSGIASVNNTQTHKAFDGVAERRNAMARTVALNPVE